MVYFVSFLRAGGAIIAQEMQDDIVSRLGLLKRRRKDG